MTDINNPASIRQLADHPPVGGPVANNKHSVQELLQHKKLLYIGVILSVLVFVGAMILIRQGQNKSIKTTREATTEKQPGYTTEPMASARDFSALSEQQEIKKASYYLKPASNSYTVGQTMNIAVMVNARGQAVDGAEFLLKFDPKVVTVGLPITGQFFSIYAQKNVDIEAGTVRVIALQKPEENKTLNEEVLITLPITFLQKGLVTFTFDQTKSHIAGYGGKELLEEITPLTITVN